MPSQSAPPSRRRGAMALLTLVLVLAGLAAIYLGAIFMADTSNASGQCSGLGFGCQLTPRDSLIFAGVFVGLPALFATFIMGALGCAALLRWTRLSALATGFLASLAALVLCGVALGIAYAVMY